MGAQWGGERSAYAPGEADIDTTRRGRGTVAILTSAALLVGVGSACSAADHLTSAMKVKQAVEKLGERDSVSVTARFDATEEQILAYLQEGEGPGKGGNARRHARLLADLELAAAVSAGMPLRDVARNDRFDNAAALNFGGNDVFALKSVDRKLYTRVNLAALAREVGDDGPMAGRAGELEELARQLPGSLATARSALRGEWVRVSPNEFGEIGRALGGAGDGAVENSDRIAQATALLRDPALQQQVVSAVEKALGKRARFASAGKREGAEHITLTLNAKDAAHELGKALAPVRAQLGDPDLDMLERAPDKDVRVGLAIRHERLSTLTVDVGQFDRGRSGALPLKLTFAAGEVVSVAAPADAKLLAPHDLLEALAYAASRHPELSTLR